MTKKDKQKTVSLWQLFITFLKVGAFTFGGGYAMIAILEEELVSKKQWITDADMLNMVVIAESTPGVIAVNTATSVGFRLRGVLGSLVATLGVVLPSFCIIFGLSFAINAFRDNVWYKAAFSGIQACVTILILNAFIKMSKQLNKDVFSFLVMFAAFAVAVFTKFNVIFVILIGGVLGVCYTLIVEAIVKHKRKQLPLESVQTQTDDAALSDAAQNECGGQCENGATQGSFEEDGCEQPNWPDSEDDGGVEE